MFKIQQLVGMQDYDGEHCIWWVDAQRNHPEVQAVYETAASAMATAATIQPPHGSLRVVEFTTTSTPLGEVTQRVVVKEIPAKY